MIQFSGYVALIRLLLSEDSNLHDRFNYKIEAFGGQPGQFIFSAGKIYNQWFRLMSILLGHLGLLM